MGSQRARIGMIGAGWVTAHHLAAWRSLEEEASVVAICDPDPSAVAARAEAFGIAGRFASAEAMLDEAEIDALDICSPRETHAAMVRLGAGRGLAMMCQKPLAPTLAEAEALVSEVGGSVPLMVHENWRFRPYYRRLRAWLDEGRLGTIRQVRLEFCSSGMIAGGDGRRPALVRQPFLVGLERMLVTEILIHHLDTLRFLLGNLAVDAAWLQRTSDATRGEDVASIALHRVADGVPVFVSGNLAVPGAPPLPSDALTIVGSRGVARVDGAVLTFEGERTERIAFDAEASYAQAYRDTIAHFLDGLNRGGAFETAPADNLLTLALVEEVYRMSGFESAPRG
jgi:predicted dehydrogenase